VKTMTATQQVLCFFSIHILQANGAFFFISFQVLLIKTDYVFDFNPFKIDFRRRLFQLFAQSVLNSNIIWNQIFLNKSKIIIQILIHGLQIYLIHNLFCFLFFVLNCSRNFFPKLSHFVQNYFSSIVKHFTLCSRMKFFLLWALEFQCSIFFFEYILWKFFISIWQIVFIFLDNLYYGFFFGSQSFCKWGRLVLTGVFQIF